MDATPVSYIISIIIISILCQIYYLWGGKIVEEHQVLLTSHKTPQIYKKSQNPDSYYIAKVPVFWILQAEDAGALRVGLALWFFVGVTGSRAIEFTKRSRDAFQLERSTVYRGLKVLENAKLVELISHKGSPTIVTLLDGPPPGNDQGGKISIAFSEARAGRFQLDKIKKRNDKHKLPPPPKPLFHNKGIKISF